MVQKKKAVEKNTGMTNAQKLGIGVGLTTAAVAAAGAYFLYGTEDAPENRKKVKSGILKAKAEVLEVLERAEHITEEEFHALVDGAVKTYGKAQNLSQKDLKDFKKEMMENWEELLHSGVAKVFTAEQLARKVLKKPTKKAAKNTVKKTTKKAVKKAPKKTAKKTTKKTVKKVAKK